MPPEATLAKWLKGQGLVELVRSYPDNELIKLTEFISQINERVVS